MSTIKVTVGVDGMMCGMCEAHVQDAVRNAVPSAKKVKADRKKKDVEFLSDTEVDEASVKKAIADTGYDVTSYSSAPYEKKGLFHF